MTHTAARRIALLIIVLALGAVPARGVAQIVASPAGTVAGAGPRLPVEHRPVPSHFGTLRDDLRAAPPRDTYIRISTIAIVIGVVILVLLLV